MHADVPQLPPGEPGAYLAILADNVRRWKPDEDQVLVVCFPRAARDFITGVIQGQARAAI